MKTRLQQWLAKRFVVNHETTLGQNRILIFVFGQGYVFVALILMCFIAGINYANNLILAFCFLIAAILWMSFYVTFKQLHQIQIEMIYPDVGQLGQAIQLQLLLKQPTNALRYLHIECDGTTQAIALQQMQQSITLNFVAQQRGYFQFPRLKIYSSYPFGLVRAWSYVFLQQGVWVAPQAAEQLLQQLANQQQHTDEQEEFRELRQFVQGDTVQSVSWKHLARGQGLMVKQFDDMQKQQLVHINYDQMLATSHEQKLSMMMSLLLLCEQNQSAYCVILPHQELPLGQGDAQGLAARLLLAQA